MEVIILIKKYSALCFLPLLTPTVFLFADVGAKERISDSGVVKHSRLYELLEKRMIHIPEP